MNALAGGGTFATLPALIALGLPANIANATSNVALFNRHRFVVVGHETHAGFSAPTSYDMELRLV